MAVTKKILSGLSDNASRWVQSLSRKLGEPEYTRPGKADLAQQLTEEMGQKLINLDKEAPEMFRLYDDMELYYGLSEAEKGDIDIGLIKPDTFRRAAAPMVPYGGKVVGESAENIQKLQDLYRSGIAFDELPFLTYRRRLPLTYSNPTSENIAKIVGHEGRHRSRALAKEGAPRQLVRFLPETRKEGLLSKLGDQPVQIYSQESPGVYNKQPSRPIGSLKDLVKFLTVPAAGALSQIEGSPVETKSGALEFINRTKDGTPFTANAEEMQVLQSTQPETIEDVKSTLGNLGKLNNFKNLNVRSFEPTDSFGYGDFDSDMGEGDEYGVGLTDAATGSVGSPLGPEGEEESAFYSAPVPDAPPAPPAEESGFFSAIGKMISHAVSNPLPTIANLLINYSPYGMAANTISMFTTGKSIGAHLTGDPASPMAKQAGEIGKEIGIDVDLFQSPAIISAPPPVSDQVVSFARPPEDLTFNKPPEEPEGESDKISQKVFTANPYNKTIGSNLGTIY